MDDLCFSTAMAVASYNSWLVAHKVRFNVDSKSLLCQQRIPWLQRLWKSLMTYSCDVEDFPESLDMRSSLYAGAYDGKCDWLLHTSAVQMLQKENTRWVDELVGSTVVNVGPITHLWCDSRSCCCSESCHYVTIHHLPKINHCKKFTT